jgi:ADP-heptose:LPS heptosyltransferase
METIIISPYSQKLRNGGNNPKNYPYWKEVVIGLKQKGYKIIQIGVKGEEKICDEVDEFCQNLSLKSLEDYVKKCVIWLSVDNFFHHFCAYHKKPGFVIFAQSDPRIYGHKLNFNLLKDRKYLRPDQFNIWEACTYNKDAYISAEEILKKFNI